MHLALRWSHLGFSKVKIKLLPVITLIVVCVSEIVTLNLFCTSANKQCNAVQVMLSLTNLALIHIIPLSILFR